MGKVATQVVTRDLTEMAPRPEMLTFMDDLRTHEMRGEKGPSKPPEGHV